MKKILLAATVAALSSTAAFAADLPARTYTKAPAYVAPIYNWTGFYIGAQVGGAFTGSNGFTGTADVLGSRDDSSFIGGGVVGANYQFAPNWVVGLEGEFNGLSNDRYSFVNTTGDAVSLKNDWLASVTGRLGYTWGPGMIYAKGGVAFRDNGNVGVNAGTVALVDRKDTGYTVGAGLEYMFAPAWSAKIEYQYYNFDHTNVAFAGAGGPSVANYRDDLHTVKAGINYHFNWGGPVVAKY
ncbi:Opacity protein antigens [Afipia felis]|uniref:Opacity protein antigens n=1 Tax=Afipia felis TaxID=1035 RepID=A0A090N747_AFIFE|nr:outer membrane protein [Afipia felis]CEG07973.1 Opacity protein antigens [Afipia felis]